MKLPGRIAAIVCDVAAETGVTPEDILGRSTARRFSRPRQEAMRRSSRLILPRGAPPSMSQIGRWFDRDHTTVLHALRREP